MVKSENLVKPEHEPQDGDRWLKITRTVIKEINKRPTKFVISHPTSFSQGQ